MVPNELCRIKLWRISREAFRAKARVPSKPFTELWPSMNCSVIPQKEDRPPQVSEQMPQKACHLSVFDVLIGIEVGIEPDAPSVGGDAEGGDGRDLLPRAGAAQYGSFPSGSPRPANVGDEQKAGLIQKDQMGSNPCGVFLYGASGNASNVQWPSRPAPWPASPVSDNSSPARSKTSTYDAGGSRPQISAGSARRSVVGSTDRWNTQSAGAPSRESWRDLSSAVRRAWGAFREPVWPPILSLQPSRTLLAIGKQSLRNSRLSSLRPTASILFLPTRWRVGDASRVVSDLHVVA